MRSLTRYTASDHANTHETFADLVFCALVVLVLFVVALAIEVSQRIRAKLPTVVELSDTNTDKGAPSTQDVTLLTQLQLVQMERDAQLQELLRQNNLIQQLESMTIDQQAMIAMQQQCLASEQADANKLRLQIADQKAIATKLAAKPIKPRPVSSGVLKFSCQGWWEQTGLGRQRMKEFEIEITNGMLYGRGKDVVGDFVLRGHMGAGEIAIQKTYFGKHSVNYHGRKDRGSTYRGRWNQPGLGSGPWYISVRAAKRS